MSCRQVVRHRILIPAFEGSNPSSSAKDGLLMIKLIGYFLCRKGHVEWIRIDYKIKQINFKKF